MTIDQAIQKLKEARKESPLKGDTVVFICVPDFEYQPVTRISLTEVDHEDKTACLIIESEGLNLITADSH